MKKRFAFLMAVAMMLSLLVGCGSRDRTIRMVLPTGDRRFRYTEADTQCRRRTSNQRRLHPVEE